MFFNVCKFHLQFWQMYKHFANKFYSINTYLYSPVWIMMVYNNFDSQNLLLLCLQISPQIFAILQNFPINNLRDQQFCTLLCELERPVVVLFTGNALEVEVPPGMVWYLIYLFYNKYSTNQPRILQEDYIFDFPIDYHPIFYSLAQLSRIYLQWFLLPYSINYRRIAGTLILCIL